MFERSLHFHEGPRPIPSPAKNKVYLGAGTCKGLSRNDVTLALLNKPDPPSPRSLFVTFRLTPPPSSRSLFVTFWLTPLPPRKVTSFVDSPLGAVHIVRCRILGLFDPLPLLCRAYYISDVTFMKCCTQRQNPSPPPLCNVLCTRPPR